MVCITNRIETLADSPLFNYRMVPFMSHATYLFTPAKVPICDEHEMRLDRVI